MSHKAAASFWHLTHHPWPWWALSVLRCQGSADRRPCVLLPWTPCSPRLTTCHSASKTNLSLTPGTPEPAGTGERKRKRAWTPPPRAATFWTPLEIVLGTSLPPRPPPPASFSSPAQPTPTWPVTTPLHPCHFSPGLRRAAHPRWEISGFL